MKIFTGSQIREIDRLTIETEPVSSDSLMERAALSLAAWLMQKYGRPGRFVVFCGPGNNGGDGLALARLLSQQQYQCRVYKVLADAMTTDEWKTNHDRLVASGNLSIAEIVSKDDLPRLAEGSVVIDALFGSGLKRPLTGLFADAVDHINNSLCEVISVDMPSGLLCEDNSRGNGTIVKASHTLTFQFPKLAFLFPENEIYTGDWHILPIGLSKAAIENTPSQYELITSEFVAPLLSRRRRFAHKGDFGHGLLIGGSYGKMGAVVMGAKAALRSGIGLVTCHVPSGGNTILQVTVPEAMTSADSSEKYISNAVDADKYDAVAIGPGLGMSMATNNAFDGMLRKCRKKPLVLDADGLNILAANKDMYNSIPQGTILTPHPREFERLAGRSEDSYGRLRLQVEFSRRYKCIVVQKGAFTSVSAPDGQVWFNTSGNPGMATAGSGDVLTGILLSLLAQGYEPLKAAIAGVFIHGLAGDIAVQRLSPEALTATDITMCIGDAFNRIRSVAIPDGTEKL